MSVRPRRAGREPDWTRPTSPDRYVVPTPVGVNRTVPLTQGHSIAASQAGFSVGTPVGSLQAAAMN
jgi:hypothetical protein